MRYAGLIKNDIAAGKGVCVTFFTQGCPHKCQGCHNPETWDFNGGKEFTNDILEEILHSITENGIQRNFCVQGGEPLCDENLFLTYLVLNEVKRLHPNIKIYLWTGYVYEDIAKDTKPKLQEVLNMVDYLIDGPYIQEERDITLSMRGSKNQRILNLKEIRK